MMTKSVTHGARLLFAVVALGVAMLAFQGCRSKECARMEVCCQKIEDLESVGTACGRASAAVGDPQTCQTILETVQLMFEEREEPPPEACRASPGG